MRRALPLLALLCLSAACSSSEPATLSVPDALEAPSASPAPQGPVPVAVLQGMLLQPADLPSLTDRRASGSADLTTEVTPQLALCTQTRTVAPHEIANVLAKPPQAGQAQVFELLSVFATPAAARQAFDLAVTATTRCTAYEVDGVPYRVVDVGRPTLAGADAALQYRLTTPDVVGGDVLTVAVSGRSLVLLTGYGAPPAGQTLLQFQAAAMVQALRRLAPTATVPLKP